MKKLLSVLAIVTLLTTTSSVMAAPGGPGGHGGPGGPGGISGGHHRMERPMGGRHNPPTRVHRRRHHGVALYTGLGARHCYWGDPYCDYRLGWYDDYYYPPEPYYIRRYPYRPIGWGGGIFINF